MITKKQNKMAKNKLVNEDTKKEYLIDSLRYTITLPLFLIFLLLLWHWNYNLAFWIFLALIVIEYAGIIIKMNKLRKKLFN